LQDKTVGQYALEGRPGKTGADQSWQALKTLLETRINAGLAGKLSARSIDEILAEELATIQANEVFFCLDNNNKCQRIISLRKAHKREYRDYANA